MINNLVNNEINELEEIKNEGFKITDLESANWCFRKIGALQNRIDTNKSLAESERRRIDAWENKAVGEDQQNIEYFSSLIKEYFTQNKAADSKFKLTTPYGKVSCRKSKKFNYENEEEIINFLQENNKDELIRIKKEINKSDFKKIFKNGVNEETGEVIPGLTVTEEESITVKVE